MHVKHTNLFKVDHDIGFKFPGNKQERKIYQDKTFIVSMRQKWTPDSQETQLLWKSPEAFPQGSDKKDNV